MDIIYSVDGKYFNNESDAKKYEDELAKRANQDAERNKLIEKINKAYNEYSTLCREYCKKYADTENDILYNIKKILTWF